MKNNTLILLISTAVCIAIITVIAFFIVWLGFPTNTPKESFKDALDFSGGLFGGLATFGSAIVAAYLFNDWRETQTAQNRSEHAKAVKKSLLTLKSNMDFYRHQVSEYSNRFKLQERKACKELQKEFLKKYHILFIDLKINLDIYENTYNETLVDNIDGPHLKAYFICIQVAFNEVINMNDEYPNVKVAQTLSDIEKFHNSFHQDFFLPILNKLNPHINLVG